MGKEFKNIDELFKSALNEHQVKAPVHVKKAVFSKFGINYLGTAIIAIGVIGASILGYNLLPDTEDTTSLAMNTEVVVNDESEKADNLWTSIKESPVETTLQSHTSNSSTDQSVGINNTDQIEPVSDNDIIKEEKTISKKQTVQSPISITTKKAKAQPTPVKPEFQPENSINDNSTTITNTQVEKQTSEPAKNNTNEIEQTENKVLTEIQESVAAADTQNKTVLKTAQTDTDISDNSNDKDIIVSNNEDITLAVANTNKKQDEKPQSESPAFSKKTDADHTEKVNEEKAVTENTTGEKEGTLEENAETIAKTETDDKVNEVETKEEPEEKTDDLIEKITRPKNGYWMVGFNGGLKINNSKYNGQDTEFNSFLAKNQVDKFGYFSQLNASYTFNSGLMLGAGVGYETQSLKTSYWKDSTTYSYEFLGEAFSHTEIIYVDTGGGNSVAVTDSVFVPVFDTTAVTSIYSEFGTNKASYVQLPIRLGYQFEKDNWIIGVNGGIQINYLLNTSGTYFLNNQILDLSKNSNILNRPVIHYNIGGSLNYKLSNNLFINGQIDYSPRSTNYYNSSYSTKYMNYFQLGLGLNLKL